MLKILVFSALGVLVSIMVFMWLVTRVRYRIGSKHVKVLILGLPIRRLAIAKIESISKRVGDGLAEHWWSTFRPKHRLLVLRRRRGIVKNFVITPKNRYVFKTDLERAMQRVARKANSTESARETMDANEDGENSDHPSERSVGESTPLTKAESG